MVRKMSSKSGIVFSAILGAAMLSSPIQADVFSEAAKIGANAGAMDYCKKHISKSDDKSKYKLLSVSTFKEYDKLDPGHQTKRRRWSTKRPPRMAITSVIG